MVVVEIVVQAFTHAVETMHEVDPVEGGDVRVGAVTPVLRDADGFGGVFAEREHLGGGY